jgi:hypothetical protein
MKKKLIHHAEVALEVGNRRVGGESIEDLIGAVNHFRGRNVGYNEPPEVL